MRMWFFFLCKRALWEGILRRLCVGTLQPMTKEKAMTGNKDRQVKAYQEVRRLGTVEQSVFGLTITIPRWR